MRIGLLGHGRVGRAVCDLIAAERDTLARRHGIDLRVTTAFVRNAVRPRDSLPRGARVVDDAEAFLAAPHDIVVEVLGGVEPAAALVETLLSRGVAVVTANKLLLAERGAHLATVAAASGAALRFEASVAAGVPLFSVLERSLRTTRIVRVAAILNGTSNFVLSRLARGGTTVAAVLDEARRLGLAEADSTLDMRGADAAHKLRVLALAASGRELPARSLEVRGIERVRTADCTRAAVLGHRLKPVAYASAGAEPGRGGGDSDTPPGGPAGRTGAAAPWSGWVGPAAVESTHPLASVEGAQSGVLLTGDTIEDLFLAGPGAGPVPTAASIVDDLVAVASGAPGLSLVACPVDDGAAAPPPPRLASRWLVTFAAGATTRADTDEILRFAAAQGISFRRLCEIEEPDGPVVAGITSTSPPETVERVGMGLRTVGAVRDWSAFRVVPALR